MSDNEPIYLTKVLVTVGKLASEGLRSHLKLFRAHVIALLEGRITMMSIGYERDGREISLSEEQILNALVNGQIFHVDPEHTRTAADLRKLQPLFYIWPTVNFFIMPILKACVWLYHQLWHDGILERADYPVGSQPPETTVVQDSMNPHATMAASSTSRKEQP